MSERIVVIGASAAGLRAAARAKRLLPGASVLVLDASQVISYGACGLPYYLSGDISNLLPLRATAWGVLRDPDFFEAVKDLEVRIGTRVTAIDRAAKTVTAVGSDGAEQAVEYDKLVIATGARPRLLPGVAADHPRVSVFKSTEDAKRWRGMLETGALDSIAIIGAGYIGIELAEAFGGMWGCRVELIEAEGQVLSQILDPEMAALVGRHLAAQGVNVHTGTRCESLAEDGDELVIKTNAGEIRAQHAICAIGVMANAELASDAGLELGPMHAITVDENLLTSDPDIYAAGDCVQVTHRVSGAPAFIPLGSLANRQGRAIGDQLGGRKTTFGPVVGSGAVKVFDYNVSSTGLSQTAATRAGIETGAVWGTFDDKAHYYPESKLIRCKLVYEKETLKVVGFQAVGEGEVVKRVDVVGNLIHAGGTIDDLLDLEFAYAPPFAPAVDALYVLGCVAGNQERDGLHSLAPTADLAGYFVVDVRTAREASSWPVDVESKNVPLEELRDWIEMLPDDKPIALICAKGPRSGESARILLQSGRKGVVNVGGGMAMRT